MNIQNFSLLLEVPREILKEISNHLEAQDFFRLRQVCHYVKAVLDSNAAFWKNYKDRHYQSLSGAVSGGDDRTFVIQATLLAKSICNKINAGQEVVIFADKIKSLVEGKNFQELARSPQQIALENVAFCEEYSLLKKVIGNKAVVIEPKERVYLSNASYLVNVSLKEEDAFTPVDSWH